MNKPFAESVASFEVDIVFAEGASFNLGALAPGALATPRHCSGSAQFCEPRQRVLRWGHTIMANCVVGGMMVSGDTSDYVTSLRHLQRLRIGRLLPGHGRVSTTPEPAIRTGPGPPARPARPARPEDDSHALFASLRGVEQCFDDVMHLLRDLNSL